jgi:hypothetical protein
VALVKATRGRAGLSHVKRRPDCFCNLQARPPLFSASPKSPLASSWEHHTLPLHSASQLRISTAASVVLGTNGL